MFLNIIIETATTINEDPRATLLRYQHALEHCFIEANIIKVLVIGAAGVGKTNLLHLLLNEEPPNVRCSTPVMERPVQVYQTAHKSDDSIHRVTHKELYELMAHTVNRVSQNKVKESNLATTHSNESTTLQSDL